MKCPKCGGKGSVDNPRYYNNAPSWSWSHGISPSKKCSNCNGSGYIIGNINEIADRLLCAANGVTITPKEAKEMYDAIMK